MFEPFQLEEQRNRVRESRSGDDTPDCDRSFTSVNRYSCGNVYLVTLSHDGNGERVMVTTVGIFCATSSGSSWERERTSQAIVGVMARSGTHCDQEPQAI
jgi:hypothetical protein